MEYNPLRTLIKRVQAEAASLKDNIKQWENEIRWYKSRSGTDFTSKISRLNCDISTLKDAIIRIKKENTGILWLWGYLKSFFKRKELRDMQAKKNAVLREQGRYLSFNHEEKERFVELGNRHLKCLEQEIRSIQGGVAIVDEALEEVLEKIKSEKVELRRLNRIEEALSNFEKRLDNAENSYEKAMVHKDCEREYGLGSPMAVRRQMNLLCAINTAKRTIQKLENDAETVGRNSAIPFWCKKLVLDGSNLCFKHLRNGKDSFVGLSALKLLVGKLREKEIEFVVYFDHSILRSVKKADLMALHSDVRISDFDIADKLIVAEASKSRWCFILSHDKFDDFKNSPVYEEGRILNTEICPDEIYVKELKISIACQL